MTNSSSSNKPQISIYSSAHRPQNWMGLYKSIGENDVSFEMVFVGPNEPDFDLPPNFRFIKSMVKPTQCFEAAVRNARADLILEIYDDIEFKTPRPLDKLYSLYKSYKNSKMILSCRFVRDGIDMHTEQHFFGSKDPSSPLLAMCPFMSKKLYLDIGGKDKNFIAVMSDIDITMRVLALGGEVVLSDVYVEEVMKKRSGSTLCSDNWGHDRTLLENLWVVDGKVNLNRARPVEPFSDYKILEQSQGPRGKWRGNSPLIFEKLVDSARQIKRIRIRRSFLNAYRVITNFRKYPEYAKRLARPLRSAVNVFK